MDWRADWGTPLWQVESPAMPLPPPARCDVAVIGGGFTGLSAAYHLARTGCRVALFEAARIGDGASGRTGGLALEGTADGPRPGVEHCLDELAELTTTAGIDCDLDLRGCWEVAHRPERVADGPPWRDGGGWLHVERTVPGGTIDPGALVAGLARAARAAGATIHEEAAVRRLDTGAAPRLYLDGASVDCAHAVVAVNGYLPDLLPLDEPVRAPLTLALCTAPLDAAVLADAGFAARLPFYTVDLPYLWGRWVRGNRLLLGAGLLFADDERVRTVDLDSADSRASLARLEARVRGLHPALAAVTITHRWGGPIAFRAGAAPLLAALPGQPRVLIAGAYAGHGVALSLRAGRLLADAISRATPLPAWGAVGGA
ncbi:MAG: NAD(P)/FAD-dependent oxidoreductase [Candidatus Binatia bacterium]